ncbi:MAG: glycosyltransferase [Pyrinomonadaceae bacterium]
MSYSEKQNGGNSPREIWIHLLSAKVGGGITYLRAMLPTLIRQLEGKGVRVVLLLPAPLDGEQLPDWIEVRTLPVAAGNEAARFLFDQVILPLWLLAHKGAVLYCSASYSPLIKTVPTVALLRNAVHFDGEFLRRERRSRRLLLKLQGVLILLGARSCLAVQYPSRSMRDLVELKHPKLRRLGVVNYYGIDQRFIEVARNDERVTSDEKACPETFLYVMNYTFQKNLGFLLRALALAKREGMRVRVVVTSHLTTGRAFFREQDQALIDEHDLIGSGYLVTVGPKYGDELIDLYRSVDACIFPSICESFGLPLVEAMAMGKPLICADRAYAREICQDYSKYVDPDRPDELVQLWKDWPRHSAVPSLAIREEILSRFSWPAHVANLIDLLIGTVSHDRSEVKSACAV